MDSLVSAAPASVSTSGGLGRLDAWAQGWAAPRGRWALVLHEFVCFGLKQAWACLFGACLLALLLLTWACYPAGAWLARYDFLVLAAFALQCLLLALRLETREEAMPMPAWTTARAGTAT